MLLQRLLPLLAVVTVSTSAAMAADGAQDKAKRPAIQSNRWEEDWSVLADPSLRTEPLDGLKYIPLSATDPKNYMSFGGTLRERFETNHAPNFRIGAAGDSYLIQRAQFHIDMHLFEDWQVFTEFEDDRAFGKQSIGVADADKADLRLAFIGYSHDFDEGTFKARVGRQDFAFDLQRFVSSRDGPNVRQSFDAVWADWETGPWRFIGFTSQPVDYRNNDAFDDTSSGAFRFSMLRVERQVLGTNELSAYWALYDRDSARYLDASGAEQRHVIDMRFAGKAGGYDWDMEGMGQFGSVGDKTIVAWAFGARTGYTFDDLSWKPRLGVQVDVGSGDKNPGNGTVGTFNPLFPNGYYFSLAGYTSYANLIHVKPAISITPMENLTITTALGLQWRQTTQDAIYVQPNIAVAGTAGKGRLWSGAYAQLRADYAFNANLSGAIEAVYFDAGNTIRRAGGSNGRYLGAELKLTW